MPNKLTPPPPTGTVLDRWLALLYQLLTAAGQILWSQVSKAGSNLTDIETRNHADLQNHNTASYTHLTATNHTDLTDGGDSTLHFHAADRARANHTGTQESSTVLVDRIGSPTYSTLQQFINLSQSAGRISGGALSDAGSGNLNVAAGTGWVRIADDDVSSLRFFDWTASNGNAIPTNTARYVGVQYNAGSPQVVIKTTDTWDEDTEFQLGEVVNEGAATLQIINDPWWVSDSITNIIQRFSSMEKIGRDNLVGGITLGETGTRNVTVTAGKLWSRLNDFTFNAFNSSSGGTFDIYYRNGSGGFTKVAAATQWPNTQYDDGSGTLVTMTNNKYANLWFYVETDNEVVMLYGQNQYNSASAAEIGSPPSTLPARLQTHGVLIGRIIFQKSAATATTISSAFATVFNPVASSDHELLANLLGGAANDHYHETAVQNAAKVLKTDKLSAFAATTSAELASVISDETGSGSLVFGTSPILTTPTIESIHAGGSERIKITTAGAIGLGTTPPADATNFSLMMMAGAALSSTGLFRLRGNAYFNGTNVVYQNTGISALELSLNTGVQTIDFLSAAPGTAGNTVSFTTLLSLSGSTTHVTPGSDNTQNFGSGSLRWKEIFAGNATINTSDAREKTPVRALSSAELAAANQLSSEIGIYQWLSAINEKGDDGARLHVGMTVQRAMEIFVVNGLDPFRYGLVCYDEWEEKTTNQDADVTAETVGAVIEGKRQVQQTERQMRQWQEIQIIDGQPILVAKSEEYDAPVFDLLPVFDEAGRPVMKDDKQLTHQVPVMIDVPRYVKRTTRPAGNRYGFRGNELLLLIAAGFNARLNELERKQ